MGKIIKCKKCGDLIQSKHRHDMVWCKCHSVAIDGGDDYCRWAGDKENIEFYVEESRFQAHKEEIKKEILEDGFGFVCRECEKVVIDDKIHDNQEDLCDECRIAELEAKLAESEKKFNAIKKENRK